MTDFLAWTDRVSSPHRCSTRWTPSRWNTDKRYLRDLADAGLPIVPTVFLEPGDDASGWRPADGHDDFVVKPAVSAGSARHDALLAPRRSTRPRRTCDGWSTDGRTVMVQPYLDAVDTVARPRWSSSAASSRTPSARDRCSSATSRARGSRGLFAQEQIDPRDPSAAQLAVAAARSPPSPVARRLLFARVDLIPDPHGSPQLLELELTEPSLFLSHSVGGGPARRSDRGGIWGPGFRSIGSCDE